MSQKEEQAKLMDAFSAYIAENHLTLTNVAGKLGVTQNTISNWRRGANVSVRNQQKILSMMNGSSGVCVCRHEKCACRENRTPVMDSLLEVLGTLPDRAVARLYAYALELRDGLPQYGFVQPQYPSYAAAENPAPFNQPADGKKKRK